MGRFAPTSIPDSTGAVDLGFSTPLAPQVGIVRPRSDISDLVSSLANGLGVIQQSQRNKEIKIKQLEAEEKQQINDFASEDIFAVQQNYNDLNAAYTRAEAEGDTDLAATYRKQIDRQVPLLDSRLNRIIKDTSITLPIRIEAEKFLKSIYQNNSGLIDQTRRREDAKVELEKKNLFREQFDFALADLREPTFMRAAAGVIDELEGASAFRTLYSTFESKMRDSLTVGGLEAEQVNSLLEDPEYKSQLRGAVSNYYSDLTGIQSKALEDALDLEEKETYELVLGSGINSVVGTLSISSFDSPSEFANQNIDTFLSLGYAEDENEARKLLIDGVITQVDRIHTDPASSILIAPEKLENLLPLASNTGEIDSLNRAIDRSYQIRQSFASRAGTLTEYNTTVRESILSKYEGNEKLIVGRDKRIYDMHPVIADTQILAFAEGISEVIPETLRQTLPSLSLTEQDVALGSIAANIVNEVTLANGALNNDFIRVTKQGLVSADPYEYLTARYALAGMPELRAAIFASYGTPKERSLAELSYEIPMTEEDRLDPSARQNRLSGYVDRANTLLNSERVRKAVKQVYDLEYSSELTDDPDARKSLIDFIARQYIEDPSGVVLHRSQDEVTAMIKDWSAGVSINAATGRVVRHDSKAEAEMIRSQWNYKSFRHSPNIVDDDNIKKYIYIDVQDEYEPILESRYGDNKDTFYRSSVEATEISGGTRYVQDTHRFRSKTMGATLLADTLWKRTSIGDRIPGASDLEKKSFLFSAAEELLKPESELFMYGTEGRSFIIKQEEGYYQLKLAPEEWDVIRRGPAGFPTSNEFKEKSEKFFNARKPIQLP